MTHDQHHNGNGHASSGNGDAAASTVHAEAHHDDEIAHVTPMRLLLLVWGALMVLTVLTVAVTSVDLGGRTNFAIAMLIATIKAGLVVTYFMHLRWDRPFNTLVFLGSLLFVSLFISLTLLDKSEYEQDIERMYIDQAR